MFSYHKPKFQKLYPIKNSFPFRSSKSLPIPAQKQANLKILVKNNKNRIK